MSMYIEDDELRGLYEGASADHLEKIEAGLLKLERDTTAAAVFDELLRELHSLKGDSRMLGVTDAEGIAHRLEDILGAAQRGDRALGPADFDLIHPGVDALRKIAREAVTGEPSGVDPTAVVASLGGDSEATETPAELPAEASESFAAADLDLGLDADAAELAALLKAAAAETETPSSAPVEDNAAIDADAAELAALLAAAGKSAAEPITEAIPEPIAPDEITAEPVAEPVAEPELPVPEPATPVEASAPAGSAEPAYAIETVRVTANQLDGLAARASELAVTKLRFERRLQDIDALLRQWENWSQEADVPQVAREQNTQFETLGQQIRQLRANASLDTDRLEAIAHDLEGGIRGMRLLPLETVFKLFPRTVRNLSRDQGKEIDLEIAGSDILADKRILEEIKAPLVHLLRNAIDHGIETPDERVAKGKSPRATLRLRGARLGNRLALEISDDGRGLDLEAIKQTAERRGLYDRATLAGMSRARLQNLIFAPGFSTRTQVTEISGRGVGLDVVRANIERLKGTIQVESVPNRGCTFRLSLGTDLSTTTAFIVTVGQQPFAIPVDFIQTARRVSPEDTFTLEGSPTISFEDQPVSVAWLAQLLGLPARESDRAVPCVIIEVGGERLGVLVDELLAQQEVALKAQSKLLQRTRNIAGATILGTGEVCMVLDAPDLLATARAQSGGAVAAAPIFADVSAKPHLLLVEDSLPIRTQVRRILEGAGYDVTVAVDGRDGWDKLRAGGQAFSAVVSDVEMPHLSGLEMTARIRQYTEYADLPIVLVTTLAKESDRRRGLEVGANAYLTKGDFDQTLLLNTLRRLV